MYVNKILKLSFINFPWIWTYNVIVHFKSSYIFFVFICVSIIIIYIQYIYIYIYIYINIFQKQSNILEGVQKKHPLCMWNDISFSNSLLYLYSAVKYSVHTLLL